MAARGFTRSSIGLVVAALVAAGGTVAAAQAPAAPATGAAPGAPGTDEQYLPASKSGISTVAPVNGTSPSPIWLTVQKTGGLGEIFYPSVDAPAARALQFVVADRTGTGREGAAVIAGADGRVTTTQVDGASLRFRQSFAGPGGRWHLTASYVTDPARPSVLTDVAFSSRERDRYRVYAIFDPALSNSRSDDAGRTDGQTLIAQDDGSASAFSAVPAFARTSNGIRGTSDGWTDLLADGRLDAAYTSAPAGNLVQTGQLRFARGHATIVTSFGPDASTATANGTASLARPFAKTAQAYAGGWHHYLAGLSRPPSSLRTATQRQLFANSAMVLAAAEDKTHRGAYVASLSSPWAFGTDDPSGPYHLVWARDLYQIATGLIAAGDVAGANRAVDFLFDVQQKPDGSFPQNSRTDGTPFWTGLQLDEVALPIVLAHQLRRTGPADWAHVKAAADFLLGFEQDGQQAPWTPQERWENQSGYSPNTIATQIAGLVCAADIATQNGDPASAQRYLATADLWQAKVKDWTLTTNGPYSSQPYFLRLTKDGNPDAGTTYSIGDGSFSAIDQRQVVDPSFLDLVRLGVLPASDRDVKNSLDVVDAQLGVRTPAGTYWHRASFDGFGEELDGSQWEYGEPADARLSRGRAWPLLNGERGEYSIANGQVAAGRAQLGRIAAAAGPGGMLPEQVWDDQSPSGQPGFEPGTPTNSATPLVWTHAQFLRLAADAAAGRILEQPAVVAARYASG